MSPAEEPQLATLRPRTRDRHGGQRSVCADMAAADRQWPRHRSATQEVFTGPARIL